MTKENTLVYKGIAIIMIVFCHGCAAIFPFSIARLTTPLGGIGVSVFLFLSGYGLNESAKSKGIEGYWKKKIEKVVYPYLIVFSIYILLMHKFLSLKDIFLLLLTLKDRSDYYYWYIGYQFFWYFCYYISLKFYNQSRKMKYIVLSVGVVLSFSMFNTLRAEQSIAFILGVMVSEFPELKKKLNNNYYNVVLMILGLVMLATKQLSVVRNNVLLLKIVQLLIKTPLALVSIKVGEKVAYCYKFKILKKGFKLLGKYSYEIYLTHAIALLAVLGRKIDLVSISAFFLLTVIGTYLLAKVEKLSRKSVV